MTDWFLMYIERYITADFFHPQCHMNAAFNSMAHRICTFQLSPQNYENENKKIIEIGRVNGYPTDQIQRIIKKHDEMKTPHQDKILRHYLLLNGRRENEFQFRFIVALPTKFEAK
jgi:hypothetical protein